MDYADEGVFANVNTSTTATVTLGSQVKAIHDWMFYGVPIQSITIPENVTNIGQEAFANNSQLTTVTCKGTTTIPALDGLPFANCANLYYIYVPLGYGTSYVNKGWTGSFSLQGYNLTNNQ